MIQIEHLAKEYQTRVPSAESAGETVVRLLSQFGKNDLDPNQIIATESGNGSGKSDLMLGMAHALRKIDPTIPVLVVKGSGNNPVDPLIELTDAKYAYPDGIKGIDLEQLYLSVAEAQLAYQKAPDLKIKMQTALATATTMCKNINGLLQIPNIRVLMDRSPISSTLAMHQQIPQYVESLTEQVVEASGLLPIPHHYYLYVNQDVAVQRLQSKGENMSARDISQIDIETADFISTFSRIPSMVTVIDGNTTRENVLLATLSSYLMLIGDTARLHTLDTIDLFEATKHVQMIRLSAAPSIEAFNH